MAETVHGVPLTSLWTAAWRADESARPDALFHDRLARALAGPEGFAVLEGARAVAVIEAPFVPVRTVFLDRHIRRGAQVVLLAAGMDARAFRLAWPAGSRVFELDLPELLELKERRLRGARPGCTRISVPADLAGAWPAVLAARGFRREIPTVWILEGLLLYLEERSVTSLLAQIDALSAPGSTLLADVMGRTMLLMPQLEPLHEYVRGLGAPWLFGSDEPEQLLEALGWQVTVHDLATLAVELGRWPFPVIPPWVPGAPRSFLIEAVKPARRDGPGPAASG